MAKQGNAAGAKILAKQLVSLRAQRQKSFTASAQITNIQFKTQAMQQQVQMATAMGTAAKVMGQGNKMMDPVALQKTMEQFGQESMKMDMTDQMMNDMIDSMDDAGEYGGGGGGG